MKQICYSFFAGFILILIVSSIMQGQIPRTISFQGVLTDSLGKPVGDGSWGLTFRLYDDSTEGSQLWTESKVLQTSRGLFSTGLGDVTPFGASVTFDKPYWLAIQAGGQPQMTPRIPLTAVAYSISSIKSDTAKYAETVSKQMFADSARVAGTIAENSITNLNIIDGTIGTEDIAPTFIAPYSDTAMYARNTANIPVTDSARIAGTVPNGSLTEIKIANSQVVKSLNNLKDNIILAAEGGATITSNGDTIIINAGTGGGGTGIQGVQNTDASLTITDPNGPTATINVANLGIKSAQIANAAITPAKLNSAGAGVGQAMIWNGSNVIWGNPVGGGLTLPFAGSAISETNVFSITNTGSNGYGIYGKGRIGILGESELAGYGIYGKHLATSGPGHGVYGLSESSSGYGVHGWAKSSFGTTYGVGGTSYSTTGYGVYGFATAITGTNYGVYGESNSSSGRGVQGVSPYLGTYGRADGTTGVNYGVYGKSMSTEGYGVYGTAEAATGVNYGVYGTSSSAWGRGVYGSGQIAGVEGRATATDVVNYGVYGSSASTIGYGVYGVNIASSGSNFGVYGESYSTSGRGVQGISPYLGTYGRAEATTGLNYGVYGRTYSTEGYGVYGTSPNTGVYGVSTATSGEKIGVYGKTNSPDGAGVWGHGIKAGVVGIHTGNTGAGIIGYASGLPGKAAIFNGFVAVMGELYKTSGSFRIDHPLDPENKYLFHSFVESPERKNIYDGTVILDVNGAATIIFPDWFGALNKEFRYQLTAIGTSGPNLYIASEVNNNQFKIAGGTSGMKVSWQVTGIRKDAYAERYPQPIEEFKQGRERGKYLHPELYGKPREEGIGALHMPKLPTETMKDDENLSSPKPPALDQKAPSQSDQQ
ncbi:MAG: hypothetical protein C0417_08905 [Chlorobiaceae bacterium]|nr:hypothetical protein [Chlorobiaceae bacterium]